MARPVLLVGRDDAELAVAVVAPDLWSIRSASFGVPAWALDAAASLPLPRPWLGGGLPSATGSLDAVALWDRALASFRQATVQQGGSAPALALADDTSPQLALGLGFDAIAQAVRYRQLALAERNGADLAAHLVTDPSAVGDQPQALRQAFRWRSWATELAGLRRRWRDALAHALQALAATKRLVKLTGESPEALRDLAIALERLGDVAHDQGDRDAARQFFLRDLGAAEAALRQSPFSKGIGDVLAVARSRLAALNPPPDPAPT